MGEIDTSLQEAAMGVSGKGRNLSLPRPRKTIMTMQFGRQSTNVWFVCWLVGGLVCWLGGCVVAVVVVDFKLN